MGRSVWMLWDINYGMTSQVCVMLRTICIFCVWLPLCGCGCGCAAEENVCACGDTERGSENYGLCGTDLCFVSDGNLFPYIRMYVHMYVRMYMHL